MVKKKWLSCKKAINTKKFKEYREKLKKIHYQDYKKYCKPLTKKKHKYYYKGFDKGNHKASTLLCKEKLDVFDVNKKYNLREPKNKHRIPLSYWKDKTKKIRHINKFYNSIGLLCNDRDKKTSRKKK